MIENRDANRLAFHRSGIIAPIALFAPGLLARDARAQHNAPGLFAFVIAIRLQTHRFRHADRHASFLRVAEDQFAVACLDRDIEIEQPLIVRPRVNPERALVCARHRPIGRNPFVARFDHAGLSA